MKHDFRQSKNILKKIEAGDSLTDNEREILQGIQKFNQIKGTSSKDGVAAAPIESKQQMEVSAE